jgi:hypothetical protein
LTISHDDLIQAVAYCRLGKARPVDDRAFEQAKRMGLLAQDPTWRATPQGEGALIAAGLMEGKPAPERRYVTITEQFTELMGAMQTLASNVRSFLDSLPFMAPESVGMHADVRLRQPLDAFHEAVAALKSHERTEDARH